MLTAYFAEEFKFSRRKATNHTSFLSVAFCLVALWWTFDIDFAGIKVENISLFDIFDYTTANVLMPLGGLLTCIFVAWCMKPDFLRGEITNYGALRGRAYPLLQFTLRYFTPLLIAYIFIKNLGLF